MRARVIELATNYRSRQSILDAAYAITGEETGPGGPGGGHDHRTTGGDRDVAVGGRVDPGGGARERDVARTGEDLAAHRVALAEVVERHHQAVQQGQVDALAPAGALPVVERGDDAERAEHAGVVVRD